MKNVNRLLAAVLALLLLLGGMAFAEDAVQDTTAAANEHTGLLATINGVELPIDEAYSEYQYYAMVYYYYGYSDAEIEQLKNNIVSYYVDQELIRQQCEKLGLIEQLDEEAIRMSAQEEYEAATNDYLNYVNQEGMTREEAVNAAKEMLEEDGYGFDYFKQYFYRQACILAVMEYYEKDVVITEEDVHAYYEQLVEQDRQLVEEDPVYYDVMTGYGERVMYVPEGLRAVKHILVMLSEEDEERMYTLEADLEAIELALEGENADAESLNARKLAIEQEMDAIYATIEPRVEEIMNRLADGEDFIKLMNQYGEDPGMTYEPYMTDGYFVHADSEQWVIPFRDAAMALEKPMDISSPIRAGYGLHIIRYEYDVPAGAVDYESVREELEAEVRTDAFDEYFEWLVDQWEAEAEIELYLENLDA